MTSRSGCPQWRGRFEELHGDPLERRGAWPHGLISKEEADIGDARLRDGPVVTGEEGVVEPGAPRHPRVMPLPEAADVLHVGERTLVLPRVQRLGRLGHSARRPQGDHHRGLGADAGLEDDHAQRRVAHVAGQSVARQVADPLAAEPDAGELSGALVETGQVPREAARASRTCIAVKWPP